MSTKYKKPYIVRRYISVTKGLRGWFAVLVEVDSTGFHEPAMSSPITCTSKSEAIGDAQLWASSEGIRCEVPVVS